MPYSLPTYVDTCDTITTRLSFTSHAVWAFAFVYHTVLWRGFDLTFQTARTSHTWASLMSSKRDLASVELIDYSLSREDDVLCFVAVGASC